MNQNRDRALNKRGSLADLNGNRFRSGPWLNQQPTNRHLWFKSSLKQRRRHSRPTEHARAVPESQILAICNHIDSI